MANVHQLPNATFFDVSELPFTPARWEDGKQKPREWLVDGFIPMKSVTLLSGDGGLGKSLLCQQLCTCVAIGNDFLGMKTQQGRSFALFCEDEKDELERRQNDINKHYACAMKDLEPVQYMSRPGKDNILARYEWGPESKPSDLMHSLVRHATRCRSKLVVIDTASDVFGGNEIRKDQVRNFITHLTWWAMQIGGAILLTAHVSNEGLTSQSGLSGSRAWSNSVRARAWLTSREKDGPNERWLRVMKSNYGPAGGKIKLTWNSGVFIRQDEDDGYRGPVYSAAAGN